MSAAAPAPVPFRTPPRLTDALFRRFREEVDRRTGIHLTDGKRELVQGRLTRRLRKLGLPDFEAYLRHLETDAAEAVELVNVITTNVTSFYRHPEQFQYLEETILATRRGDGPVRIWSAGCSTGEEPWSLVGSALAAGLAPRAIEIVATDIDTEVLRRAREGVYSVEAALGVDPERRRRLFQKGVRSREGLARVRPELRACVQFRPLNLFDPWPTDTAFGAPFDAVFCRNVAIYFTAERKKALYDRLIGRLAPGGHLFLGSSETLVPGDHAVEHMGRHAYRRSAGRG